ncbi:galactose-3-O-sulfotransferase 3 [Aplysia californica]|uniref:Galactose-3-O-sulfotransferase 3 n=1 Tax=Aplysia californica TaxID=6500 RepID=A0ABM0JCB6_APLCA|nr:galactose-3-O-sulfotransferase 3 [Aplysia californica]
MITLSICSGSGTHLCSTLLLASVAAMFLYVYTIHDTFHTRSGESSFSQPTASRDQDLPQSSFETVPLTASIQKPLTGSAKRPSSANNPIFFKDLKYSTEKEKQHVVFVKVHKAASTTMQSIFLRYAIEHDLNVLLSKSGLHINERSNHIPLNDLYPVPAGSRYDILCNHLIFDYKKISPLFPEDTFYLGIVREPFSQFLSAFVYYSQVWKSQILIKAIKAAPDNPIEEFLNHSMSYVGNEKPNTVFINNRMSVDFGFPLENFEASKRNHSQIASFLKKIDTTFDVVLIAEMFDESLVLLRRMLGWTTKDIIYLDKNVFSAKHEIPSWIRRHDYPPHVKHLFRNWAAIDISFYNYFLNKFKDRISFQPKDFYSEVKAFKTLKPRIASYCSAVNSTGYLHFQATEYTSEFVLTQNDCALMNANEYLLTSKAQNVQKHRFFKMGKPPQKFNES